MFKKQDMPKYVEMAMQDAEGVKQVMMNDFHDHFKACPVYFFADSNAAKIKANHFENVLLNTDGKPAADAKPATFYIVYYGYTVDDPKDSVIRMSPNYHNGERMGKGLVVTDENYVQMRRPFPYYTYRFEYFPLLGAARSRYSYQSEKFDIDYWPMARRLNERLAGYVGSN